MRPPLAMCLLPLSLLAAPLGAQERVVVQPVDTGAALANPGMGWTLHYYSNIPTNYGSRLAPWETLDEFPGLTTVYLRIPWSYLEPEEGVFNWSVVDGPAQRWIAKGKQIALRISCSESWMRYATPEWVEKAGAKGYNFTPGQLDENGPFWEPDYNDPVFLEKLDHFLAAMAARYDGNPEVAFIDVGSFGVWGEGHLWASTQMEYPGETIIRHIDLHLKHFRNSLLAANDDFAFQGDEPIEYSRQMGLALRDDSILVQPGESAYLHAEMAQGFWPTVPVILECEHYGPSRDRGNWQDGSLYLQAVEEYHASYAAIHWWPDEFLAENRALIDRINQRLGYRIQLVEASWPAQCRPGDTIPFELTWRNAGVAPCYEGGYPAVTLKAENPQTGEEGLLTVFVAEGMDVADLPVGPPGEAEAVTHQIRGALPFYVGPGTYSVWASVGGPTGTPRYALPHEGEDGGKRYRLGTIEVTGDYDVALGVEGGEIVLESDGEAVLLPLRWEVRSEAPHPVTPFCHLLAADGEIALQGHPATDDEGDLNALGVVESTLRIDVPAEARGRTYELCVGLWMPSLMGQPNERLLPQSGGSQNRVLLGALEIDDNGRAVLRPAR
ncbi:MAG: DUF4832 domain-containing protein [Armatimonadetes bacterium]|jgi:hypothetical protein|nr:DUF4832 domain-containing protein [Armatimonadota bacterium]